MNNTLTFSFSHSTWRAVRELKKKKKKRHLIKIRVKNSKRETHVYSMLLSHFLLLLLDDDGVLLKLFFFFLCVCVSKRPCINVVHTHNYEIQEKKKRFFFFLLMESPAQRQRGTKKPQIIIAIQEKTAIMDESKLLASLLQSVDPFFSTVPLSSLPFLSLSLF